MRRRVFGVEAAEEVAVGRRSLSLVHERLEGMRERSALTGRCRIGLLMPWWRWGRLWCEVLGALVLWLGGVVWRRNGKGASDWF